MRRQSFGDLSGWSVVASSCDGTGIVDVKVPDNIRITVLFVTQLDPYSQAEYSSIRRLS